MVLGTGTSHKLGLEPNHLGKTFVIACGDSNANVKWNVVLGRPKLKEGVSLEENRAATSRRGTWGQLANIFFAPGRAFAALAENHNWLPPYVVGAVVNTLASLVAMPAALAVQVLMTRRLAAQNPQMANVDLASVERISRLFAYPSAIVGAWVMPLFLSLVLAFVLWLVTLVGRDAIGFRRLYGLAMWATLPAGAVSSLLQAAWMMSTPAEAALAAGGRFNASLTLLTTTMPHATWTYRLLSTVNVFTLWTAVLVAMGYFAFSRRSAIRAALAGVAYWLVGGAFGIYSIMQVDKFAK